MKHASYNEGVAWIASNDEPTEMAPHLIAQLISTQLLADLFEVDPLRVGIDVAGYRLGTKRWVAWAQRRSHAETKRHLRAVLKARQPEADKVDGYDRDDLGESPDF